MNNKQELLKIIQENPDLPIVFFAHGGDFCDDYYSTAFGNFNTYIAEIYEDEEQWYDGEEQIVEDYMDRFCDKEEYEDLTDEEFEKAIKEWVNTNIKHYKAIVISMGH